MSRLPRYDCTPSAPSNGNCLLRSRFLTGCGSRVGDRAAVLLWQRGMRSPEVVAGFCNPDIYQPTSPWAFAEMEAAVQRFFTACDRQETVTIWGDFDADGVTATAVLWEGLSQFLDQDHLNFYIPNRFTESHGVSVAGIESLHEAGTQLVITCDTGSTSLAAISRAAELGIDVIITDHHTLPAEPPDVVAMLNPRQLMANHPLATLSGVAVAYKVVEALYERRPEAPQSTLGDLTGLSRHWLGGRFGGITGGMSAIWRNGASSS